MEDLDMGQASSFFRQSSVVLGHLTHTVTKTSLSLIRRGLDVSRRDLRARLRRLRGGLRALLSRRRLAAQTPVGSR
jgi:hypothetical protein